MPRTHQLATSTTHPTPHTFCVSLATSSTHIDLICTHRHSPDEPSALLRIDLRGLASSNYTVTDSSITIIKRSSTLISSGTIDKAYLSTAKEITFPTTLPNGNPATAHAIIFEPQNKDYVAPKGSAPPCVFNIHGGPSASAGMGFNLQTQFWTSRGFMVCAVNYGGTTGYGREYLERLTGEWGVTDVNDCIAAAKYLGSQASMGAKPFDGLTEAEQEEVRKEIEQESTASDAVIIEEQAGGGVKVTVRNTTPAWGWSDILLASASIGLAVWGANYAGYFVQRYSHCIPPLIRPTTSSSRKLVKAGIAALSILPYIAGKIGRVASETVSLLPDWGSSSRPLARSPSSPTNSLAERRPSSSPKIAFWTST